MRSCFRQGEHASTQSAGLRAGRRTRGLCLTEAPGGRELGRRGAVRGYRDRMFAEGKKEGPGDSVWDLATKKLLMTVMAVEWLG